MNSQGNRRPPSEDRGEVTEELRLNRRSYIKLAGIVVGTTSGIQGATGRVSAASNGYGEGSFGDGGYGGTNETSVSVSTDSASDITDSSATLNGSLDDLGGASSAECYFEWRESGVSSWSTTPVQTLSSTVAFSEELTGLSDQTDYEFRAITAAEDGSTDTGATVTFSTRRGDNAPRIDTFSVSEAGSPNPHAEITCDWQVGDTDGDLATVTLGVYYTTGEPVDVRNYSVSGSTAAGTDSFEIKHVAGKTFDVKLDVSDDSGNLTSRTKQVSE